MIPLQRILARIFRRMGDGSPAAARLLHGASLDLSPWLPVLTEAVHPLLSRMWRAGARRGLQRIVQQVGRRCKKSSILQRCNMLVIKRMPALLFDFDLFNRRILTAVDQAVFAFCQSTLDTIEGDITTAVDSLHAEMREGLETGEAVRDLTRRVYGIFHDPARAFTIARTESQRAVNGGQLLSAKESGIVTHLEWLASSDACSRCLALNGKRVKLDEPFYVDPKGGPYAVVKHPPLHPRCFCVTTEIIDYDLVAADVLMPVHGLAFRERLRQLERTI